MLEFVLVACIFALLARAAQGVLMLRWAVSAPMTGVSREVSPPISVLIPCYNEEQVLERTLAAIFASQGIDLRAVICIDDGSTDGTLKLALRLKEQYGDVLKVVTQANSGKALALNRGLEEVSTPSFVCIDADTQVFTETLHHLAGSLLTEHVAAVSGNMIVGGGEYSESLLCRSQKIEYEVANNIERCALSALRCVLVVPGAISAFSTCAVRRLGGFSNRTMAEDTDITLLLLSQGHQTLYQPAALAVTEVPVTLAQLYAQRLRWSTGKLQVVALQARASWHQGGRTLALWLYMMLDHCLAPLLSIPVSLVFVCCWVAEVRSVSGLGGLAGFAISTYALCFLIHVVRCRVASGMAHTEGSQGQWCLDSVLPVVLVIGCITTWHALFKLLTGKTPRWSKLARRGDVRLPMT